MSTIDHSAKAINVKVVYYGPGLGGKTSSLQSIHDRVGAEHRGQLISLATGEDRTLYFDFFPLQLPKVRGYTIKVHLYTVPGQSHYNSTRKLVLNGADGVVFVADSQTDRFDANLESMQNLEENLRDQAIKLEDMPLVLQYNKRDAPNITPVSDLDRALNPRGVPWFGSVAIANEGVFEGLKEITKLVLRTLSASNAPADAPAATPAPSAPAATGAGIPTAARETAPPHRMDAFDHPHTASSFSEISRVFNIQKRNGTPHDAEPVAVEVSGPEAYAAQATEPSFSPVAEATADEKPAPSGTSPGDDGLLELVQVPWVRDAGREARCCVEDGQWAGAVRLVISATRRIAKEIAANDPNPWPVAAVLMGVPAERFVRFEAITEQSERGAPLSRQAALFGVFFLVDTALRWQALQLRESPTSHKSTANELAKHP